MSSEIPVWPVWDRHREPGQLWRYVHPDIVAAMVERRGDGTTGGLPGPGSGSRLERAREAYRALSFAGIRYADERFAAHGQHVRDPGEVLGSPRIGNCLDLSLIYAGACLHAGLHPIIVVVDREHAPAHAFVVVWMDGEWRGGTHPDFPLGDEPHTMSGIPGALVGAVRDEADGHGAFLAIDVALAARSTQRTPVSFEEAVVSGAGLLVGDRWSVGVDVGRVYDGGDCYQVWPGANPLTSPYANPAQDPDPDQDDRPLRALWARFPTVRFTPRPELLLLRDHFEYGGVDSDAIRLAVVHSEGGAGKTRLAAELAQRLAEQNGWITGFLPRNSTEQDIDWLARTVTPLLVVVDYAEAARQQDLERLLLALRRDRRGLRACVLLTSRSLPTEPGSWWATLTSLLAEPPREGQRHIARPLPIALQPRHPDPDRLFYRAYDSFGGTGEPWQPTAQLSTLDIVMFAWLAAHDPEGAAPQNTTALYDKILRHEIRYWNRVYARRFATTQADGEEIEAPPLPDATLRQALACVTATGTTTRRLEVILRACPTLTPVQRAELAELIPAMLPDDGDGQLRLQPDPVGDHLAATTFVADLDPQPGLTAEESRPLLLRCLDRCTDVIIDDEDTMSRDERLNVYLTITRSAQTDPLAAARLAETALRSNGIPEQRIHWEPAYAIALAIGGPFAGALEDLARVGNTPLPLTQLATAIPFGHSALARLAAVAARHAIDTAPDNSNSNSKLAAQADRLSTLSGRLSDLGGQDNLGQALNSNEEAVTLYRRLAEDNPAYLPDLAGVLGNLGIRLSEVGRLDEALSPVEEAVTLYRRLAEDNPAYLPDLAMSLGNLGFRLSEVGRLDEALSPVEEAVTLHHQLAEANPAYLPDLAGALNNLGIRLSEVGRRDEALSPAEEAVTLYRRLAEAGPAAYLPDLAMSLSNLGIRLSEVGRRDEALSPAEEAVTLYRRLAAASPAAYLPKVATSLSNLGAMLSEVGRRDEALTSTEEAVTLHRQLAANPACLPDLALALNNLGTRLSEVGRHDEALAPTEEAVTLHHQLAEANPAYLPDLALALNNLGARLSEVGRHDEALAPTEEAVTLYHQLAKANPAHLPNVAGTLNNLGIRLSEVGRRDEALSPVEETATLYRQLAEANPAYLPGLAMSLNNLGAALSKVGRRDEALSPVEEAVTLYRQLAEANPAYLPDLAMSLNNLGAALSKVGRLDEALSPAEEAVTLHHQLAEANPAYLPDLAGVLGNLGIRLSEVGRRDEALSPVEEAVTLYRRLAEASPAAYLPDLAMSLDNLGTRLSEVGRLDEALSPAEEAVTLYRRLAEASPAAYLPDLAMSLGNLGTRLSDVGRLDEALSPVEEAVTLYRRLAADNAAYLPGLAGVLSNLGTMLSEVGRRDEALSPVEEAVTLYRRLAAASPAAYLPNLAKSLNNLGTRLSEVGRHSDALAAFGVAAAELRQASGARVLAARARFRHAHEDRAGAIADLFDAIKIALAEKDPHCAGPARREIRDTVRAIVRDGEAPDDIPPWALMDLDEGIIDILNTWTRAARWREREALIRDNHAALASTTPTLHAISILYPENSSATQISELTSDIAEHGLDPVLTEHRHNQEHFELLNDWTRTESWRESQNFLSDQAIHDTVLNNSRTDKILAHLGGLDRPGSGGDPVAAQHLGIVQLARRWKLSDVFDLVTDPIAARDAALDAVQDGKPELLQPILLAAPRLAQMHCYGPFLTAVAQLAHGDTGSAAASLAEATAQSTEQDRATMRATLRRLIERRQEFRDVVGQTISAVPNSTAAGG
ncbi:tetratricopeptide repeat protein [Nocardia sp. KC 131]|uniref:tetratricopeptide repeat protein n=1 Tax=Nocardia arseniciresistens TaxID=3392119 RepID=UPI00398E8701